MQVTTDLHGDCTLEFQGTSSAAPLGAGCIALVLEAKYVILVFFIHIKTCGHNFILDSLWNLTGACIEHA